MKIFVTGVTGFVGSHVAEVLLQAGHEVVALARNPVLIDRDLEAWIEGPSANRDAGGASSPEMRTAGSGTLRIVKGSLADEAILREAVRSVEAVVHVAGLVRARSEAEFMRVNRDGAEALLRAAERRAAPLRRFVLISSQAAGGPSRNGRPVSGGDLPQPVSAYGRSKRAGEETALARADRLPVTILRPPVVFGARDRMLAPLFRAVARGRAAVWGAGTNAFTVVHAPDVGRAVRCALEVEHRSGAILYPSDDRIFTWRSFLGCLGTTLGVRLRIVPVPPAIFATLAAASTAAAWISRKPPLLSFDKLRELREPAWLCAGAEAHELLGWSPTTSVEVALAATHAWYRARALA